jgi:hypothetical protein
VLLSIGDDDVVHAPWDDTLLKISAAVQAMAVFTRSIVAARLEYLPRTLGRRLYKLVRR